MTTTTTSIARRVEQLKGYIESGRVLEAMDEFYHDDLVMRENSEEPTRGLAANIEREKAFLSTVKEWNWTRWHTTAIDEHEGMAFLEYSFEFVNTDGHSVVYEQAAVQRWEGDKIVSERFYHG